MLHRRVLAGCRVRERREVAGDRVDLIAVAHPHFGVARHAGEQDVGVAAFIDRAMGPAVLADLVALHAAAECLAHQLHSVADAEHGNAEVENRRIALRCAVGVHARRSAGEDDALGANSRTRAAVMSCRTISQYTCCSRTRRAMSWAYCEPKSRTSTRSAARMLLLHRAGDYTRSERTTILVATTNRPAQL